MTYFHERRVAAARTYAPRLKYTQGLCGEFAVALSGLTGWPVVLVYDMGGCPVHAMVLRPDGMYLDVEGVQDRFAVYDRWWACTPGEPLTGSPPQFPDEWELFPVDIAEAWEYIVSQRPELLYFYQAPSCPTQPLPNFSSLLNQ